MLNPEQVEGFSDDEIDEIIDRFGFEIEPGVGWRDNPAGEGDGAHILDVDEVERGLAVAQDQASAFFKCDRGGPGEQV